MVSTFALEIDLMDALKFLFLMFVLLTFAMTVGQQRWYDTRRKRNVHRKQS